MIDPDSQNLLGRDVDLVDKTIVSQDFNWIRRREILDNHQVIYGSRPVPLGQILLWTLILGIFP